MLSTKHSSSKKREHRERGTENNPAEDGTPDEHAPPCSFPTARSPHHVIGVDGGASKTYALTADLAGNILGFGAGGCGSYESGGMETAKAEIARAAALASASLADPRAISACLGLAGADFPEDFEILYNALRPMGLAHKLRILNDSLIALRGGTPRPYGVVVIMGSGTNCAGISKDGREERNISEGYLFGDWGGANSIGTEAMHLAYRAWDGRGEPTVLVDYIKRHFGVDDLYELAKQLYYKKIPRQKVWLLTPLVFEAACEGDKVACGIVRRIGVEAGTCANAMMRKLDLTGEEIDIVLAGSVFKGKGDLLFDTIRETVRPVNPRAAITLPRFEPVVGALFAALEDAGVMVDANVLSNVERTLPSELKPART